MTTVRRDPDQLLGIDEVARFLGVSKSTIRRMSSDGRLRHTRIGRQIRVRWADVKKAIISGI